MIMRSHERRKQLPVVEIEPRDVFIVMGRELVVFSTVGASEMSLSESTVVVRLHPNSVIRSLPLYRLFKNQYKFAQPNCRFSEQTLNSSFV